MRVVIAVDDLRAKWQREGCNASSTASLKQARDIVAELAAASEVAMWTEEPPPMIALPASHPEQGGAA